MAVTEYTSIGTFNGQQVYVRTDANRPLAVGDVLHGYCGGTFGRDHYACCAVEAVGPDWVVVRDLDGGSVDSASGRETLAHLREYRKRTVNGNGDPCCPEVTA